MLKGALMKELIARVKEAVKAAIAAFIAALKK